MTLFMGWSQSFDIIYSLNRPPAKPLSRSVHIPTSHSPYSSIRRVTTSCPAKERQIVLISTYNKLQSSRSSSSIDQQRNSLVRYTPTFQSGFHTTRVDMSSKLVPSNPEKVMVIREVCPDVVTCSAPFERFGLIKVGGRGTIIRMQTGSIAVFSPVALTDSIKEVLQKMNGQVKYIIAPDIEHHIFIGDWKSAYPEAEIIAPEGLKEKREKNPKTRGVEIKHIFTPQNKDSLHISNEFEAEFNVEYVHIHPNREIVLLHKPSSTLIQADLFFNPPSNEQYQKAGGNPNGGIFTKIFNSLMSAKGIPLWQERFVWYIVARSDREGFKKSMAKIDSWDFERVIPCHGDVLEKNGKKVFRAMFWWFLRGMDLIDQNRRPPPNS